MRIGLVCPCVPGHLNPLTTLGGELARRGHEVFVVGYGKASDFASRESLQYAPLGEGDPLLDSFDNEFRLLANSGNFMSMMRTGKVFGLGARIELQYLPSVISSHSIDALLIDQMSAAACVVAERLHLPFAIVCNALASFWDPLMPAPPLSWGFRKDWVGRVRNRLAAWLIPPVYRWLAGTRQTGVDPLMLIFEDKHGLAQLAQQPSFFDFPRETFPPNFHYTAPWHRADRDDRTIEFPWDWLDGRPLIYASMGTLQNGLGWVFDSILEAVADLDCQVVLSKGGGDVKTTRATPGNVLLVERAPQLRLLAKAQLAITHAGLNTALECLAHGVPMLCIPVTNDQPGVAKRVEWIGAGRVVSPARVSPARLKKELRELLGDSKYGDVARKCQSQLSSMCGPAMAANVIETAFAKVPATRTESTRA
jgi:zeaxanthin glucosyltransferase